MAQQKRIRLGTMRLWVRALALLRGRESGVAVSCGVGRRRGSDPALLWLWCRPGSYSSDCTPSLGTSICLGCGPKKQKNK